VLFPAACGVGFGLLLCNTPSLGAGIFILKEIAMKRFLIAAILGVASNVSLAQVNALPPTPHILVYGHAEARAIPDQFKISMTVSVTDPSADTAREKVQAHVEQIFSGLKQAGIPASEMTATTLSIEPRSEYDQKAGLSVYKGVQVRRVIDATFDDLGKLQRFLASISTGEELQVSGIVTGLRDETTLREQLRVKAMESTQQKAKSIAQAYSVKLAGLYSVSDVAPEVSYGVAAGDWPHYDYDSHSGRLDRIQVMGGRRAVDTEPAQSVTSLTRADIESLKTGYVTFKENVYAVFLLDGGQ
jgi:uncharacterized protein YggE